MAMGAKQWDQLLSAILEHKGKHHSKPIQTGVNRVHLDLVESIRELKSRDIPAIIGEIKPRSPSEGVLRKKIDISKIVEEMEEADVAGISVLTEDRFFGGSKSSLAKAASHATIPILMKDFLTEEEEIEEGKSLGADAVLLIARVLGDRLPAMYERALDLGVTPLVEVHDRAEMRIVERLEPELIGINNRDLEDFSVNLEITRQLSRFAPKKSLIVSESGYISREDVEGMESHCDAFLVGSSLMKSNIRDKLLELQGRRM